ncbi:MAG TPA: Asp-tRNA(Asn)/Glu-tRNA(Gln) amidotransferase subunit GatC [Candidatus Paceibacterota bacterium]
MAISEDVKKLAALARLDIPDDTLAAFAAEFDGILKYVGQLESLTLDTAGAPSAGALRNVFREDGAPHESGKYTEKLAGAFPQREGDALSVKQIISHD